jgi:hypothetical protein
MRSSRPARRAISMARSSRFSRRDPADERDVVPVAGAAGQQVGRQPVVNGGAPALIRKRPPLMVRDRHERRVAEIAHQRRQLVHVETAVQRRDRRRRQMPRERQVQEPGVEMNHVEAVRHARHELELPDLRSHGIAARGVEAERPRRRGDELGAGTGIAAGEQRDVMAELH